jgi:hypothetical protein
MAATARLIVMMEEHEKATLEARAEDANVSTAEFVRRRLFGRGEPEERALLEMLGEIRPLVRKASRAIDADLAEIRSLRESGRTRDARAAEQTRRELTRDELALIADRMRLGPPTRPAARRRRTRA